MLSARQIAHEVLVRVDNGGAFANRALDGALSRASELSRQDRAFVSELVYGTLRRQVYVDHALAHFSRRPLADTDPETRALLRLGAYQLLFTRVPERASVHTTVELAKAFHRGRPVKYVNAVLESLGRQRANILMPPQSVDPEGHLSLAESVPRWLAASLIKDRGYEGAQQLLAASNHPAPLTLRVNARKGTRQQATHELKERFGIDVLPTRYSPVGLTLESPQASAGLLRPEDGGWQAQDEAAQLVGFYAGPEPGWKILDACSAPGGKACHLAELSSDEGEIHANDVHPGKATSVLEGARLLGLKSIDVRASDASQPLPYAPEEGYDLILADVPCSGLGTVRRHPEIKTRREPGDIERLAEVQRRILDNLAGYVRPGGLLVYAVCTFIREEGPDQVAAFLSRHPDFSRADLPQAPFSWEELTAADGSLVLDPHRTGTDGFYAARLRRRKGDS